jgi:hypothetical protein
MRVEMPTAAAAIGQIWTQLFDQRLPALVTCQQPARSGQEVERAEEA